MADHDARFAKPPRRPEDLYRPVPAARDLDEIMAVREEGVFSASLTLRYDKMLLLLEPSGATRPLARQWVTVVNYPDGRFAIRHGGRDLPFRVFDKLRKVDQAAIVEDGRLGAVLAHIRGRQEAYEPTWNPRPSPGHPQQSQVVARRLALTSLAGLDPDILIGVEHRSGRKVAGGHRPGLGAG